MLGFNSKIASVLEPKRTAMVDLGYVFRKVRMRGVQKRTSPIPYGLMIRILGSVLYRMKNLFRFYGFKTIEIQLTLMSQTRVAPDIFMKIEMIFS